MCAGLRRRGLRRQKLYADRYLTLARAEVRQARKNARVRLLGPFADGAPGTDGGL